MAELLRQIPGRISSTGVQFRPGLSYEEWRAALIVITRFATTSVWLLADALQYGFWNYGKKYEEALGVTGLAYGTLRNYAYVAGRFAHDRRRSSLSFAHHAAVASLVPDEQERWLDRAEAHGLPSRALEGLMREERDATKALVGSSAPPALGSSAPPALAPPDLDQLTLAVEAPWRAAAAAADMSLVEWAVAELNAAAAACIIEGL